MSDNILVCGGPHNGQVVADVGSIWSPLVMMSDPEQPTATPIAIPTHYTMRYVDGRSAEDGTRIRRPLYCHESIQNPMHLMQALADILVSTWLEEGGEAVEEEITLDPSPRPVSGLILPGQ